MSDEESDTKPHDEDDSGDEDDNGSNNEVDEILEWEEEGECEEAKEYEDADGYDEDKTKQEIESQHQQLRVEDLKSSNDSDTDNLDTESDRSKVEDERERREQQRLQRREAEKERIQQEIQRLRKLKKDEEEAVLREQKQQWRDEQEQRMRERVEREEEAARKRDEEEAIIQQELESIRKLREQQDKQRRSRAEEDRERNEILRLSQIQQPIRERYYGESDSDSSSTLNSERGSDLDAVNVDVDVDLHMFDGTERRMASNMNDESTQTSTDTSTSTITTSNVNNVAPLTNNRYLIREQSSFMTDTPPPTSPSPLLPIFTTKPANRDADSQTVVTESLAPTDTSEKLDNQALMGITVSEAVRVDVSEYTYLELAANFSKRGLFSLQGLDVFSRLRNVDLSHNSIETLSHLPSTLQRLNVSHNCVKKIAGLNLLPNLTILDVSHNKLRALTGLEENLQLREIYASDNKIMKIQLENLWGLEILDLGNNQIRSLETIRPLSVNVNLHTLTLDGNKISSEKYIYSVSNWLPNLLILDKKPIPLRTAHNATSLRKQNTPSPNSRSKLDLSTGSGSGSDKKKEKGRWSIEDRQASVARLLAPKSPACDQDRSKPLKRDVHQHRDIQLEIQRREIQLEMQQRDVQQRAMLLRESVEVRREQERMQQITVQQAIQFQAMQLAQQQVGLSRRQPEPSESEPSQSPEQPASHSTHSTQTIQTREQQTQTPEPQPQLPPQPYKLSAHHFSPPKHIPPSVQPKLKAQVQNLQQEQLHQHSRIRAPTPKDLRLRQVFQQIQMHHEQSKELSEADIYYSNINQESGNHDIDEDQFNSQRDRNFRHTSNNNNYSPSHYSAYPNIIPDNFNHRQSRIPTTPPTQLSGRSSPLDFYRPTSPASLLRYSPSPSDSTPPHSIPRRSPSPPPTTTRHSIPRRSPSPPKYGSFSPAPQTVHSIPRRSPSPSIPNAIPPPNHSTPRSPSPTIPNSIPPHLNPRRSPSPPKFKYTPPPRSSYPSLIPSRSPSPSSSPPISRIVRTPQPPTSVSPHSQLRTSSSFSVTPPSTASSSRDESNYRKINKVIPILDSFLDALEKAEGNNDELHELKSLLMDRGYLPAHHHARNAPVGDNVSHVSQQAIELYNQINNMQLAFAYFIEFCEMEVLTYNRIQEFKAMLRQNKIFPTANKPRQRDRVRNNSVDANTLATEDLAAVLEVTGLAFQFFILLVEDDALRNRGSVRVHSYKQFLLDSGLLESHHKILP